MRKDRQLWPSVFVLLIAAAAIFSHLDDLSMWYDELFAVFHSKGTLAQVLRERDLAWPPGYPLALHIWIKIMGPNDLVVKLPGALAAMLGTAFAYRAGRRLHGRTAGRLAALAFGTSGYTVYFATEARAYGISASFAMLLVWLHLRWSARPTWRRAFLYTLAAIAWLYLHFGAGPLLILFGVDVGLRALPELRQRRVPRQLWWWPLIMAATGVAFLPLLPQFLDFTRLRSAAAAKTNLDTLPRFFHEGLAPVYRAYSSRQDVLCALILVAALLGLGRAAWRGGRQMRASIVWLLLWGVGFPLLVYLTRFETIAFSTRYLNTTGPAVFLLMGIGIAQLPRPGRSLGAALLLALALAPLQPFEYRISYEYSPPVRDMVRALAEKFKPGDVLVVDPGCECGPPSMAWNYYEALYFPGGHIPLAADGSEAGRSIWYLVRKGREDADIQASVARGRVETANFWGPWYFIATRYAAPPRTPGYTLGEDGLHFRGATVTPGSGPYVAGDVISVESWWSTDAPLPLDYSIGLYLMNPNTGAMLAQNSSGPAGPEAPPQTSGWEPGALYRDVRSIQIPWHIKMGDYQIWLAVYHWADGERLAPPPEAEQSQNSLILQAFRVESWGNYDD